jgi:hypothetical protein
MHPRLKQTNKLRQSYDEEENHGGIEQAGSTRQGKDAGSEASSTFNSCIIWVTQWFTVTRQDLAPRFSRDIFRLFSQVGAGVAV